MRIIPRFQCSIFGHWLRRPGSGDFRDHLLWPFFLSTKGFLPRLPKGSSACRAGLSCLSLARVNTSYCEHHPGMVRHPPPNTVLLLLPTKSVLALSTALCFSFGGPKDYHEMLSEAGFGRAPLPSSGWRGAAWGLYRKTAGFPTAFF